MELQILLNCPDAWLITPRVEILEGMLNKLGLDTSKLSEQGIIEAGEVARITTPIRLRNRLVAGHRGAPKKLIIDEGHHDVARTYQDLALLCGNCPAIAFTATPFRGTPRTTQILRQTWGEPVWCITLEDAVKGGYLAFPRCVIWPLVDDDVISIENGELVAEQVNAAYTSRLAAVVERCKHFVKDGRWDRPTMFSLPSRELAHAFHESCIAAEIPTSCVTGESVRSARVAAFSDAVSCASALIQVAVVSEGVDLPIRRLIDLSPAISPVRWMQQLGRITRPSEEAPEYICTNRNLLRHAYLLEGLLPQCEYKAAEEAFGGPGKRAAQRAVGLEAIGRLKGAELPLRDGGKAMLYAMADVTDGKVTEYTVIVHPMRPEPIWATRKRISGSGEYGRWHRCQPPADLEGYASVAPRPMSEKQEAWWKRSAKRVGLDPEAEVTRKQFQALPVLLDIGVRL